MGKLPNYVQYFGSNIVEGVAEDWLDAEMSWVEVEMSWVVLDGAGWSWVEVGARFINTRKKTKNKSEIAVRHAERMSNSFFVYLVNNLF